MNTELLKAMTEKVIRAMCDLQRANGSLNDSFGMDCATRIMEKSRLFVFSLGEKALEHIDDIIKEEVDKDEP